VKFWVLLGAQIVDAFAQWFQVRVACGGVLHRSWINLQCGMELACSVIYASQLSKVAG
jgi:hypothetical protein